MKKLMCATAILASFAAIGAFPSAETQPNAISFEGYTSATALQLVNGVNEYDEDGTQELFPYFFFEGDTDASTVKTFGGDNLAERVDERHADIHALVDSESCRVVPLYGRSQVSSETRGVS